MLQDQVLRTIERHTMFRPRDRVAVAVSGGADSVALLHVLVELAPRWNLRLVVLHLNHLLRGEESARDAAFVKELARSLGPGDCARSQLARCMWMFAAGVFGTAVRGASAPPAGMSAQRVSPPE